MTLLCVFRGILALGCGGKFGSEEMMEGIVTFETENYKEMVWKMENAVVIQYLKKVVNGKWRLKSTTALDKKTVVACAQLLGLLPKEGNNGV